MPAHSKALRNYLGQVERALPCANPLKKQIIAGLRNDVSLYLEEHPDTDGETLNKVFGTPAQIAQTYIDTLSAQELVENINRRTKLRRTVIAIVGACALVYVLLWGGTVLAALQEVENRGNLIIETQIVEG